MKELQDIKVRVTDTDGMPMEFTVPWDADIEEWEFKLKLIMVYLQFCVDEVVINPDSDSLQEVGEKETEDD
jgi:hypothetical protein